MERKLSWGILSTGSIAGAFANGLAHSSTGVLRAVGSRTQEAADRFGATWGVERCYGRYEDLLADPEVDAVYIATPHPWHAEWAIKAAEAGKHILCEKPLALNYAEAQAIVDAARRNNVFLMEAFMYRCHPQITQLVELLQAGVIGTVQVIQATFSFRADYDLHSRLLDRALGGGGILDVGCYCASMARLIAGAAQGLPFADPIKVTGVGYLGELSHVDEYALAALEFPGGIVAQLLTGVRVAAKPEVCVLGSKGSLVLPDPWSPADNSNTRIIVNCHDERESRVIDVTMHETLYGLEADTVARSLAAHESPAMSWDDTLGNMQTLDRWRAAIGMTYEREALV
jgi:Predicted dehydrogenases and related proteins